MPAVASLFCPVLSRIRDLTGWLFTGRLLVTGESNGAVFFFTTRRTREDKYLRALQVRVATWVLLIGEKMVLPDQIRFEPPGGAAGKLWPFVVACAFALRIMTFVSDHMPLGRSEGPLEAPWPLKTLIQSATHKGERGLNMLCVSAYIDFFCVA